ncbi:PGPGW domain-containing protein [Nocardioides marmorisolisilvae]|uniref:TIGR02611 family protein n=1 Tax=Nocardioides marmorisolisilvae TaxID=1542737 RepID=A0A3N0DUJ5_9ACTN|nr:PGPGW domain-containing protein [Nocardioides marmorisolisilvae]RNL79156.1 hypothetical protein EFL95_08995 [Nocardioides marmorisolisilvae]
MTALATKLVVTIVGALVLTAGLVMMVTPGPGLLGIAAGLAILATEWDWAARWLDAARRRLEKARVAALGDDPAKRGRRRWLAGGAGVAALAAGLAALLLAPDLLGG